MDGAKTITQSLTLQALIVGALFYVSQLLGLDLDQGYLTELVQSVGLTISLIIAGYGRIRATKVIK